MAKKEFHKVYNAQSRHSRMPTQTQILMGTMGLAALLLLLELSMLRGSGVMPADYLHAETEEGESFYPDEIMESSGRTRPTRPTWCTSVCCTKPVSLTRTASAQMWTSSFRWVSEDTDTARIRSPTRNVRRFYMILVGYFMVFDVVLLIAAVLESRMLPAWAIEMKYVDKKTGETFSYHDLCPKTPMIFLNHYWDGIPDSPDWPKAKPLYLMPNIEMYELKAEHYWGVDVVLCKTAICARRVQMWYQQEGNPRHTKVLYTRHTSSDVATLARTRLGEDSIKPKNWSDVQFIHAVGTSVQKGTRPVLNCWLGRPDFPPLHVYMHEDVYNGNLKNHYEKKIRGTQVNMHVGRASADDFGKMIAESAFFMCTSLQEGYGHYINQARASGAVIISTDLPPMNEFLTPESGVLIPVKRWAFQEQMLGGQYKGEHGLKGVEGFTADLDGAGHGQFRPEPEPPMESEKTPRRPPAIVTAYATNDAPDPGEGGGRHFDMHNSVISLLSSSPDSSSGSDTSSTGTDRSNGPHYMARYQSSSDVPVLNRMSLMEMDDASAEEKDDREDTLQDIRTPFHRKRPAPSPVNGRFNQNGTHDDWRQNSTLAKLATNLLHQLRTNLQAHCWCTTHVLGSPQDSHQENRQRLCVLGGPEGVLHKDRFKNLKWANLNELRPARLNDILRVHTVEYIQHLERACSNLAEQDKKYLVGTLYNKQNGDKELTRGLPPSSRDVHVWLLLDQQRVHRCIYAMSNYSSPYYTPPAVSSMDSDSLLDSREPVIVQRIAIVDFDIHHGNGTEEVIRNLIPHKQNYPLPPSWAPVQFSSYKPWRDEKDPENVFFSSIHLYDDNNFYPCSGMGPHGCSPELEKSKNIVNLPLKVLGPKYLDERLKLSSKAKRSLMEQSSKSFRDNVTKKLIPALAEFRPDLIMLSAGFDGHADDFYYFLSEDDYGWITEQITAVAEESGATDRPDARRTETAMSERKAVIKNADMHEDMQQDAVDCASQALEKYNIEKDIAAFIKKEFDKKYNPTWHCIVGRNFGSYVTHETKHFIYFYLGQVAILLFKSG
ncbi:Histone deacetylase domain [Phytophthora cactorum]|nr:Histone deacetylase domain [Phytophthora cactorum]